jgi:hypothetical protein
MVSSDIYENSQKAVLEELGSSYRAVLVSFSLKVPANKPNTRVTWNFRKTNWTKFQHQVEIKMSTINTKASAHKMLKTFYEIIQKSAKKAYPEANHANTSHSGQKN